MSQSLLDNDLYKFTMQQAILQLYPNIEVRYTFIRGKTPITSKTQKRIREGINAMRFMGLSEDEKRYLRKLLYLTNAYIDFLSGYRYNPDEVTVSTDSDGDLVLTIEGPWYRTVLWEVPLMALISEEHFLLESRQPEYIRSAQERLRKKFKILDTVRGLHIADFGTRRRFSAQNQETVVRLLTRSLNFVGTSNVYFAMEYGVTPIGTHAHEWFMFHAAKYGYRRANIMALTRWSDVYRGDLGIALTDTFTTQSFLKSFDKFHAKLFDGVRHDSGDPFEFIHAVVNCYHRLGIDPTTKTIVFSDGLTIEDTAKIIDACSMRIKCSFGIGTHLTNDIEGITPLNIVIKLSEVKLNDEWYPAIKLSDSEGKHTGPPEEVDLCKKVLHLNQ